MTSDGNRGGNDTSVRGNGSPVWLIGSMTVAHSTVAHRTVAHRLDSCSPDSCSPLFISTVAQYDSLLCYVMGTVYYNSSFSSRKFYFKLVNSNRVTNSQTILFEELLSRKSASDGILANMKNRGADIK